MHPSPSVYLMWINIILQSSALPSLESDSLRSTWAMASLSFPVAQKRKTVTLLSSASTQVTKSQLCLQYTFKPTLQLNVVEPEQTSPPPLCLKSHDEGEKCKSAWLKEWFFFFGPHLPKNKKNQRLFYNVYSNLRNVMFSTCEMSGVPQLHLYFLTPVGPTLINTGMWVHVSSTSAIPIPFKLLPFLPSKGLLPVLEKVRITFKK